MKSRIGAATAIVVRPRWSCDVGGGAGAGEPEHSEGERSIANANWLNSGWDKSTR